MGLAFVRIVVIALLALLGYYVLLFLMQRQLLYPAPRGAVSTRLPSDVRRIELRDGDDSGYALYAAAGDSAGSRHPAIIFTHGNAERVEDWAGEFGALQRRGVAVLMPEYPGYGTAGGYPTQESITNAAVAAYDWLHMQPDIDTARIVAYGRSLGGGAATRLATRRPVAGLVLESSFTTLRAFAGQFYAPGFLVRDPFDSLDELKRYKGPLLVLHGRQDPIAPFAQGEALAAAVSGAEFLPMACGHNDCERPWPAVLGFLQRHQLLDSLPHN
jgi:fermentation-respiration switch protein FrsA (DUF1100 family)